MQGSENSSNSKREEFSYSGEEDSSDSVGYKSRVRLRQRTKKEYLKKKNIWIFCFFSIIYIYLVSYMRNKHYSTLVNN